MAKEKQIVVTVTGPAHIAEIVKREVATALSHVGAFEVTAEGDFHNGTGQSHDPDRLDTLAAVATDNVSVYVRRR